MSPAAESFRTRRSLPDISIDNPVFAWMLMTALIVFGAIGFRRLGVSQMPDVEFPVVSVQLTWEGAAPEVMETDVVDVVEDVITSIQGVRDISSTTRQGDSTVTLACPWRVEEDMSRMPWTLVMASSTMSTTSDSMTSGAAPSHVKDTDTTGKSTFGNWLTPMR